MVSHGVPLFGERMEVPLLVRGIVSTLLEELTRLRAREQRQRQTLAHLQDQLRKVAELQRNLLPAEIPAIVGLEVRTLFRPADTVSGDLYDVVRLDERRIAFCIADATGHGLPAGMLSAVTRRSLLADARPGRHPESPDRVLARANREILDLGLRDCEFIGATYAVYDEPTRSISWARGGLPYPILVSHDRPPRQVASVGPALGAVDDPTFELVTVTLQPGDRLIFHTDGVDALLVTEGSSVGPAPRCGDLSTTDWFHRLSQDDLAGHLDELDQRHSAAANHHHLDDLTVLALHATTV